MLELNRIYNQDCLEGMKLLEANSVDLIVTDPPYGIDFMQKSWDVLPSVDIWKECLRVLKPGAFAFVMCTPRQDSLCQMMLNLTQAGFCMGFSSIYWVYLTGFPKAMNISKAVDRKLGTEREVIGKKESPSKKNAIKVGNWGFGSEDINITTPTSEQAKALDGSYAGVQLKPAVEVVLLAMKPLSEKTYVEQALKNNKGCTWLDDCRIPYESEMDKEEHHYNAQGMDRLAKDYGDKLGTSFEGGWEKKSPELNNTGRFPANLLVSEDALGAAKSEGAAAPVASGQKGFGGEIYGKYESGGDDGKTFYSDKESSKSVSRYFDLDKWAEKSGIANTMPFLITPKAATSERNEGLESGQGGNTYNKKCLNCGKWQLKQAYTDDYTCRCENPRFDDAQRANIHPTVKPTKLLSYLITLGSREGDLILDPFIGSGTTAIACRMLGRNFVGYELNKEYYEIAMKRLKEHMEQKRLHEVIPTPLT